jgi:hypothetical protein
MIRRPPRHSALLLIATLGLSVGLAGCGQKKTTDAASGAQPAVVTTGGTAATPAVVAAQPAPQVLGRSAVSDGTIQANVVEATRSGGVMTLKVRFTPVGLAECCHSVTMYNSPKDALDKVYAVAGDKKYFLLTDAEGVPLTPDRLSPMVSKGPMAGTWWGKFPAPPAEVKAVSLTLPEMETIDAIPLSDR